MILDHTFVRRVRSTRAAVESSPGAGRGLEGPTVAEDSSSATRGA